VIGPIFNEVVAHLVAEGFFGETVDEQSDGSDPISLNVDLSDDEGFSRQGTGQVRSLLDKRVGAAGALITGALRAVKSLSISSRIAFS
jgi:hypothetical protein